MEGKNIPTDPSILKEFYESVLSLLECPICTEYMSSPIRQCLLGHSICDDCSSRIRTCPICRHPKGVTRNYALEGMYERLTFDCRYKSEGCGYSAVGTLMEVHHRTCAYANNLCLFSEYQPSCEWRGTRKDFFLHCFETHISNITWGNRLVHVHKNFFDLSNYIVEYPDFFDIKVLTYSTLDVLYYKGKLFKTFYTMDSTGLMEWYVTCLSPEKENAKYDFEFRVTDADNEHMVERKQCVSLDDVFDKFNRHKKFYVSTIFSFLKLFCDEAGQLKFQIDIIENDSSV